jgi:hypothetical protein
VFEDLPRRALVGDSDALGAEYSPSVGVHDDGNVKGSRELVKKCPQRLYFAIARIVLSIS